MFFSADLFNGDISTWDVSRVENMCSMFYGAASFNTDLSKWDVSTVTDMHSMFCGASFRGDISKWDVSRVDDMHGMFKGAKSFKSDISNWDVSRVTDLDKMFYGATSFTQQLCGSAWVNSQASKQSMFTGSSGSISPMCTITTASSVFSPQSREELRDAVDANFVCNPAVRLDKSRDLIG